MNANGSAETQLTDEQGGNDWPDWSPDGQKIAFLKYHPYIPPFSQSYAIWTMNPDGSGKVEVPNTHTIGSSHAVWSPDGTKLAADGMTVMNADGTGQTHPVNGAEPDWQPQPLSPIVFVHGFAGSKIACGGDQLFPDIPVGFPGMGLEADGATNLQEGSCSPSAAPTAILDEFAGEDVYGPALDFLEQIAPGNHYVYVWDWRKSPQRAVAGLDEIVEQARCGGTLPSGETTCPLANVVYPKVALMGHSMGGLVIRDYINDQARADKVKRALTLGTPYWGSPKAIFPLATGLEAPAAEGLDNIIVDEEFQRWARTAQGLYFLYPSANFGDWLTVANHGPHPLDRAGLLSFVSELGGTPALLEHALDTHAQSLDGFKRNGVDYQAFVGAGLATVERILFFRVEPYDYVKLTYAQGDGTVPVRSATQGPQGTADPLGEDIPIHYSCGVKHVPLPGDPDVRPRIKDFLTSGAPIVPGSSSCNTNGFQIEIYEVDVASGGGAGPEPTIAAPGAGPGPMTLEEAELAGLIQLIDLGAQKVIVTDSGTPVDLSYSSAQYEINTTPLTDANLGQTSFYGPLSGAATISTGTSLSIADATGPLAPRSDGAPALSIGDGSVPEGSDANLAVTLSRAASFPITVDFKTADATATAGSDYSSSVGTLVFEPGQQTKQLNITTSADGSPEANETFQVALSNPLDGAIADGDAVVTLTDPDGGSQPSDTSVAGATLEAKKAQKQKGKRITIKLSIGAAEDVAVVAAGKVKVKKKSYPLKQVTTAIAGGDTEILKLRLKKASAASKIAGSLKRGTKVAAALSATFTDQRGNVATETATVRLK